MTTDYLISMRLKLGMNIQTIRYLLKTIKSSRMPLYCAQPTLDKGFSFGGNSLRLHLLLHFASSAPFG